MMYAFVREVVMPNKRKDLAQAIERRYGADRVAVIDSVEALREVNGKSVVILMGPFRSKEQKRRFDFWYKATHVVVAHLQGLIVLFFDPKLQKQYYKIRN